MTRKSRKQLQSAATAKPAAGQGHDVLLTGEVSDFDKQFMGIGPIQTGQELHLDGASIDPKLPHYQEGGSASGHRSNHARMHPTMTSPPPDAEHLLSAYDRMVMQKYYPGTEVTPYVAGMNIMTSPSVTFTCASAQTETEVVGSSLQSEPLGTADYTIIAFCPIMSILHGRGQSDSYSATEKLSGVIFNQSDSTGSIGIKLDYFDIPDYSRDMYEIYGSDCTGFAQAGFVWSSQMDIRILSPPVGLTGTYYKGVVTLGQLTNGGLELADLIRCSSESGTGVTSHVLRSAVVNHDVVFSGQSQGTQAHSISTIAQSLQQEVCSYLILQRPAQALDGTENVNFGLQLSTRGNAVFWPDAKDTIASRLGSNVPMLASARQRSTRPVVFDGHNVNYVVDTRPRLESTLTDKVKSALGWIWEHRSDIGSIISSVASFAAPLLLASEPREPIVVAQNYLRQVERCLVDFAGFNDPTLTPALTELAIELQRRRAIIRSPEWNSKRLIPVSAFINATQPEPTGKDAAQSQIVTQPQAPQRYADHASARDALARYGVERNPGPCEQESDADCSG